MSKAIKDFRKMLCVVLVIGKKVTHRQRNIKHKKTGYYLRFSPSVVGRKRAPLGGQMGGDAIGSFRDVL